MKYTVHLSSKQTVVIDQEDFDKFMGNAERGSLLKLKQAIINPSFVVAIVPMKENPQKQIEGYVDEATGKFIVTREEDLINDLADEFSTTRLQIE